MTRITDLDQFALQHVMLPYQNMLEDFRGVARENLTLDFAVYALRNGDHTQWYKNVRLRIMDIGFTFAPYVKHDLVDIVKGWQKEIGE